MATSAAFKNMVASNVYNTTTKTAIPAALYIGLSKNTPDENGGNFTEPNIGNYARVEITKHLKA